VTATANGDGSVTLRWTPAPGADGTNIYRATGGDDLEYMLTVGGDVTSYLDNTTTAGNGYAYQLTTLEGDRESSGCPVVEVTAIPVFPTVMALGLASVLGAGAYLALSVRRKLP
jgi:fibronectin type 3 domain-containing protein